MSKEFSEIVGGKWWKMDFHLHSPGSYDYGHGDAFLKSLSPEDYLKACMAKELDCIVISDHETFGWIPKLRDALVKLRDENGSDFREIVIFPGIEINVQGNVHLLGIFDPKVPIEKLYEIFGKMDIKIEGDFRTSSKSINEVMDIINENGGIAIPAHVDDNSGLFGRYSRRPEVPNSDNSKGAASTIKKSALAVDGLLALEVIGDDFSNEIYKQSHRKLSYVVGSDSHDPSTIAQRFTWVKMGTPCIEALRLALFDTNDGTIRSNKITGNPNNLHGKTYLKKLEISNGRYIGKGNPYVIQFSPWLNCLIGGRGSGKSSIISFIRMVLDRGSELPQKMVPEFKDFAKVYKSRTDLGMLSKFDDIETEIKLDMFVDGVERSLRWKNNQIDEWDLETREWHPVVSIQERFPIRMFSQKQLYEMTSDPELLLSILDSKWDSVAWRKEIDETINNYNENSRKCRNTNGKICERTRLKKMLNDINETISVFENEESKRILSQREVLQKNKSKIHSILSSQLDKLQIIKQYIKNDSCSINLDDIDENTQKEIGNWIERIKLFESKVGVLLEEFKDVFKDEDQFFKTLPISCLIAENEIEVQQLMEKFKSLGIDVDKYGDLIKEKDQNTEQLRILGDIDHELQNCKNEMDIYINKLNDLIKKRYDARMKVINGWNQIGSLRIKLIPFGDVQKNEASFRSIIRKESEFTTDILEKDDEGKIIDGGILAPLLKANTYTVASEKLLILKKNLTEQGGKKFQKHLNQLFNIIPESLDELMTWIPEDKLDLDLKIGSQYKPIDAGSPGQRTSAVLSLILGISEMPIIIDQPEDDLDTRNITDIVVNGIENLKKRQQIILVTHNPNIVVNSNSELVTQLDYQRGQISNICSGALQEHSIRDAICEVMEGGKEALEKRYYRIFKALTN